jgi:hypothetical protein
MKLSDKISNTPSYTPFYTFEFFPPRTEQVRPFSEHEVRLR